MSLLSYNRLKQMNSNSPYDIFTESLFTPQEIAHAHANAVEATTVSPSDDIIDAFKALPAPEQDMLMSKLVAMYDPEKIKMYLSWAQRYK
jgi:hypothetical protein